MTMHKQMSEIQSKDWDKMQAYFTWNKSTYAPIVEKMQNDHRYDFKKMFMEDPDLFVFYVRILEDKNPKYDVNLFWDLHYQAYQHLKADGFFNTDVTQLKLNAVNELIAKLNGPCLLTVDEIEECMTVKTKGKVTTTHFEFNDILALLEKKYVFQSRGFFNKFRYNHKDLFHKYCPDSDYEKTSNTSPVDNLAANYSRIISDYFTDKIEHIDFWHYLLEYEFSDVSNGCLKTMYQPEEEDININEIIDTKDEMQNYIGKTIKQIFFKELAQVKKIRYGEIEFYIWW